MPNGGSDCCGTCWYNARNKGEAGYAHAFDSEPAVCTIRDLAIEDPFYTFCANHPHRRPQRDPTPLGPVFTGKDDGSREFWMPSPDTEDIRRHLLALAGQVTNEPRAEYPIGIGSEAVVIWQLGEFREVRAVPDLERIAALEPPRAEPGPFDRSYEALIELARKALEKIHGDVEEEVSNEE